MCCKKEEEEIHNRNKMNRLFKNKKQKKEGKGEGKYCLWKNEEGVEKIECITNAQTAQLSM